MSLETDLVTFLTGLAVVGARIYPKALPQGVTLPAIRYDRIDSPQEYTHQGRDGEHPRIQITVHASTFAQACTIAETVKAAMAGKRGIVGTRTVAYVLSDTDLAELDTAQWMRAIDVQLWREV